MDGLQAIVAFAYAALPGVLVVEMIEFGRPRLRERHGARSVAGYLIVSVAFWAVGVLALGVDERLAAAIDSARLDGRAEVEAYAALAWRLAVASVGFGVLLRSSRRLLVLFGRGRSRSIFAWDALILGLRPRDHGQVVHVRLRDGAEVYGIIATGGRADFQAEGRGLVLNAELVEVAGKLTKVPGSNGLFVAPEAVATVALLDFDTVEPRGKVEN